LGVVGFKAVTAPFILQKMKTYAIGYCRVSTHKQAQEGESLDVQEKIIRSIAKGKGIELLEVFREAFSGKKNDRPVVQEMLKYARTSNKKISHLIVRNIDRLTRGGVMSYEMLKADFEKIGIEIIDSTGIIQSKINVLEHLDIEYEWSKFSPSAITEMVVADTAQTERRNILQRTIGAQIQLARDGYHVGYITDGYIIKRAFIANKKKSVLVPDPDRAHFWIELYNIRASGSFTDQEIVDKINSMGFKTKTRNKWDKAHENIIGTVGGNPLTVKELQQQICRPIYCGVKTHKWTKRKPIKARFLSKN
jgi:DNA invertase Pin-like site-specific DNA recombinase